MVIDYKPLKTETLPKQIARQIRQAIVEGRLRADDRLPGEDELAERYGVSRPTIREALKRLAAQNLIRSRRGPAGGTFVNRPNQEEMRDALATAVMLGVGLGELDLADVAQARRELELVCCRLAAQNPDPEQLAIMADELAKQAQGNLSDEAFCASDVRFHRALVDATNNRILQLVMVSVIEALQPVMNMVVFRFRERSLVIDQHHRLLEALKTGDAEAACAVLEEQMDSLAEQFAAAQAT
ncbi:MAG: FadR family transcriptional regulator [Chromatiaceae bacterium]|jgi:DNA-binding FadR family transcriptional regulator|nr:FadR family transcriptional regulator [Chromatiaceae bacterium]